MSWGISDILLFDNTRLVRESEKLGNREVGNSRTAFEENSKTRTGLMADRASG